MKIIKRIFLFLGILVLILLVVALFIPCEYTVSHTVTINKPQKEVYEYAKMLQNQKEWSVWVQADPNIRLTYSGEDGTVGASQTWEGNDDVGAGSQTITKLDGERIEVDLHFIKPFEGNQKAATIIKAINANSCTHTEEFYGHDPYPLNLMSIIGKKMIKDAFGKNGENLKKILEKTN
ncbi:Protein of unknown function precursor [Flavobacterium indicum GPTSA100-9 = DSM 17447]|uniref:Polyketide cyclase n=1 Tax=Flavobacterium indicum (strain DSM 17447 / CIP 109464 / GPTSA100-9) TaxID=1094466 RepID=H8XVL0_FLAIG|nr:SRPBCC family protein [Flavobacterium indicum]CCG53974.1 Protein of unknown function precursor [Flavobacterium indicum GPTSA100-9 = DSM 17447]